MLSAWWVLALALAATPPELLAQVSIDCPGDECHVAPYFGLAGGFVGRAAHEDDPGTPDVDESHVEYYILCNKTVFSGSVAPDDEGIVRQALIADDRLDCEDSPTSPAGRVEIKGLEDGGWYWVNDGRNSAVAVLVAKDKGGTSVRPTDPGGLIVRHSSASFATLLKHEASGRFGILPHLHAQPVQRDCGLRAGSGRKYQVTDDCVLSARFSLAVTRADELGRAVPVGSVVHRGKAGPVTLTANVYLSGHISMTDDPEFGAVVEKPLTADWTIEVKDPEPGVTLTSLGVSQETDNANRIVVQPASWCAEEEHRGYVANILVRATRPANGNPVIPDIPAPASDSSVPLPPDEGGEPPPPLPPDDEGGGGPPPPPPDDESDESDEEDDSEEEPERPELPDGLERVIRIACPSEGVGQGEELVPTNPFEPTER